MTPSEKEEEGELYEGKHVKVWWPADNCSYGAIVDKVSSTEIELVYDDGMRKSYPRDEAILSRITIGEVYENGCMHATDVVKTRVYCFASGLGLLHTPLCCATLAAHAQDLEY